MFKSDLPIPITVPYSDRLSSSALTETGHRRRTARKAKKTRESEDTSRRDCVRVGRRGDMVVDVL